MSINLLIVISILVITVALIIGLVEARDIIALFVPLMFALAMLLFAFWLFNIFGLTKT